MTTKAITRQLNNLSQEVIMLRSLVISVVGERDPEGEYRPEFIKELFNAIKEKTTHKYEGRGSLLKQLKQLK